jgi:hypothetical protein
MRGEIVEAPQPTAALMLRSLDPLRGQASRRPHTSCMARAVIYAAMSSMRRQRHSVTRGMTAADSGSTVTYARERHVCGKRHLSGPSPMNGGGFGLPAGARSVSEGPAAGDVMYVERSSMGNPSLRAKRSNPERIPVSTIKLEPPSWIASSRSLSSGRPLRAGPVGS